MNEVVGLVGAGGFGSEVMPVLRFQLKDGQKKNYKTFFIDSNTTKKELNGVKIITEEDFLNSSYQTKHFNVAIADSQLREQIARKYQENLCKPFSIISKNINILDNVKFGQGCIVFPNAFLTSNITIGDFFHSYHFVSIAHDCKIGDFVTVAPGVMINGNVVIEDHAYIGSGAILKQGIRIGSNATIGMGAIVISDVEANTVVAGNPAKIIRKNEK